MATALNITGDPAADALLEEDPLALLIGMTLDQQVPMEKAFHSPYELKERMGGMLDAAAIADHDPGVFAELFVRKPALHRYPGSMAGRVQQMCRFLVEEHGGHAERVWEGAGTGAELVARIKRLPGFGEEKSRLFVALLARMGVRPDGWEQQVPPWLREVDLDGADALDRLRDAKRTMKAAKKQA